MQLDRRLGAIVIIILHLFGCTNLNSNSLQDSKPLEFDFSKEFSVDDCIAIAKQRNFDVAYSLQEVNKLEAQYREKMALVGPSLKGEAYLVKSSGPSSDTLEFNEAKLVASQTLYKGGQIRSEINSAKRAWEGGKENLLQLREDIEKQTRETFIKALREKRKEMICQQGVAELTSHLRKLEKKLIVGDITELNVQQTEAEFLQMKYMASQASRDYQKAMLELKLIMGISIKKEIQIKDFLGSVNIPGDIGSLSEYLNKIMQLDHSLKSKEIDVEIAWQDIKRARGQYAPEVSLAGSAGYAGKEKGNMEEEWHGALVFKMPIWEWGRVRNNISQEKAKWKQKEILYSSAKRQLVKDVMNLYGDIELLKEQVSTERQIRDAKREELRISQVKYEVGDVTNSDLLSTIEDSISSEIKYYDTQYELNRLIFILFQISDKQNFAK